MFKNFLFSVLAMSSMVVFGQLEEVENKTWKYGAKAGMNFAELWGDDALPESDRKFGYSAGAFIDYALRKKWSLQGELIWSLQGEKSKSSGRYKISYLNIPVMLKWKEHKMYYEFGPQLGILTINTADAIPESLSLKDFETFDFSLNAGFGFALDQHWSIGFRYIQGMTNLVAGRDIRNSVFYLGVAYTF